MRILKKFMQRNCLMPIEINQKILDAELLKANEKFQRLYGSAIAEHARQKAAHDLSADSKDEPQRPESSRPAEPAPPDWSSYPWSPG